MSAVELFSGVGGLGFRAAGFSVEVAVDVDCRRVEVYGANVKPSKALCADVRELDFSKWRGIDVLLAGPPLQALLLRNAAEQEGHRPPGVRPRRRGVEGRV